MYYTKTEENVNKKPAAEPKYGQLDANTEDATLSPSSSSSPDSGTTEPAVVPTMHMDSSEQHNKNGNLKSKQLPGNAPHYESRCAFKGGDPGETDLEEEEIVPVLEKTGTGWWKVHSSAGIGWVPSHFLRLPSNSPKSVPTVADLPADIYEETAECKYMPKLPSYKESVKLKGHIAFRYLQSAHGNISDRDCNEPTAEKGPLQLTELFKASTQAGTQSTHSTATSKPTAVVIPGQSTSQPLSVDKSTNCATLTTISETPATSSTAEKAASPTIRSPRPEKVIGQTYITASKPTNKTSRPATAVKPSIHGTQPSTAEGLKGRIEKPAVSRKPPNIPAKRHPVLLPHKEHQDKVVTQDADVEAEVPLSPKGVSSLRAMFNRV